MYICVYVCVHAYTLRTTHVVTSRHVTTQHNTLRRELHGRRISSLLESGVLNTSWLAASEPRCVRPVVVRVASAVAGTFS